MRFMRRWDALYTACWPSSCSSRGFSRKMVSFTRKKPLPRERTVVRPGCRQTGRNRQMPCTPLAGDPFLFICFPLNPWRSAQWYLGSIRASFHLFLTPVLSQVLPEPTTGADACCRVGMPLNMALVKAVVLQPGKEACKMVVFYNGVTMFSMICMTAIADKGRATGHLFSFLYGFWYNPPQHSCL